MITKNEIEARMRWNHRSRQAVNVGRASPPNFSSRRGWKVGPWETPAGLSAVKVPQVRYLLTENSTFFT